jgi:lambda family phage portal protein
MTATLNGNGELKRLPRGILLGADGEIMRPTNASAALLPLYGGLGGGTGYGNYGANVTKNSLLGWLWRGGDADADIGLNIDVLRQRSRDAFMGIPLAAGAVETLDTNVIGEGLYAAPNPDGKVLGLSDDKTAELAKELTDKFDWWATDPCECDWEKKHNFYVQQHIAFQSMLLSGDCPVLFPLKPRPNTMFDLRLRILEADRIRNPNLGNLTKNIYNGVEIDNDGELLAYHIWDRHPLALTQFWFAPPIPNVTRVEPFGAQSGRRNMVLLMRPERPEQRRGAPILSVCLELLKQQGRYVDATVLGAVIQSYFTAFITSEFPDPTLLDSLLTDEQKKQIADLNPYNVQLGPGVVNFMRPGHEVKFSNPTQPTATFGEFSIACAKFVGSATGIPYEVLLKQFNASYSASRAALLDFWRRVRKYRALMVDGMCQPTYEEWMADAVYLNRLDNFKGNFDDPFIRRALCRCVWTGNSAGSLDPQKEVSAADLKVKCGFSTIERESMELNGSNWRDNVRQQATEKTEFEDADLIFPPDRPTQIREQETPTTAGGQPPAPAVPAAPKPKGQPAARQRPHELASGTSGRFER